MYDNCTVNKDNYLLNLIRFIFLFLINPVGIYEFQVRFSRPYGKVKPSFFLRFGDLWTKRLSHDLRQVSWTLTPPLYPVFGGYRLR